VVNVTVNKVTNSKENQIELKMEPKKIGALDSKTSSECLIQGIVHTFGFTDTFLVTSDSRQYISPPLPANVVVTCHLQDSTTTSYMLRMVCAKCPPRIAPQYFTPPEAA
jgi:hypothetical protein